MSIRDRLDHNFVYPNDTDFPFFIGPFSGEYRFLSNFYPVAVELDGRWYPSTEHAYQAAKTFDLKDRKLIELAPTPGQAKRYGRSVKIRSDWEDIKLDVMYNLLAQKFKNNNASLHQRLLSTSSTQLIEVNTWGDTYWGVCKGSGYNYLGKLLMLVRNELDPHL